MSTIAAIIGPVCLVVGAVLGWYAHARSVAERQAPPLPPDTLVAPLRDSLGQLSDELRRSEHNRVHAFAGLSEQVRCMQMTSHRLHEQTAQLAGALQAPQIRGRWGEIQLERVVELSGMSRHCDFSTQVHGQTPDRVVRPDLVVHLAGGRTIVVDAKAPLQAYLDSTAPGLSVEAARDKSARHAQAVRAHINSLSAKAYWAAQASTPEFVVLFLPGDGVLDAAMSHDPDLLDYAFARDVVLATPSTLIALLRTVALGWRQHAMASDAEQIQALGQQLYQRIDQVLGHLDKVGSALRRTVESYNSAVGAIDSRLGVTARKLSELEALSVSAGRSDTAHRTPKAVDATVRSTSPIR
ncbi:DNA recombination protein RmuC [Gordonia humi]|uniref:DNA recombination protein RmuC n=1 Tax=Gordonia humi TaxID=686429 RepID=A0A840F739_9ACTN|nr:DNA recombination protein RmuC [Gordonia humi]MBB4137389.1 DNA recombination protein RmuC [Gordonia humi]